MFFIIHSIHVVV